MSRVRTLWRNLVHRADVELELDDELNAYVDALAAEKVRQGLSPSEARRAALLEMAGVQSVKQQVRDVRAGVQIESWVYDLRGAVRSLRRTPAFAAIAVGTLALGIGTNTALFSVADEVVFKSVPVPRPDELVLLQWQSGPQWIGGTSAGMSVDSVTGALSSSAFSKRTFDQFRATSTRLSTVFAFTTMRAAVLSDSEPATIQLVSGNYFSSLGVLPETGRLLIDDDDRASSSPVAVISHRFRQRRFGGQAKVVGQRLTIVTDAGPSSFIVIGVTPPGFEAVQEIGRSPDISIPVAMARLAGFEEKARFDTPWFWPIRIMGRLGVGATYRDVQSELQGVLHATALEGWASMPRHRQNPSVPRLEVTAGGKGLVDARHVLAKMLTIMGGVVALVLLIVCTNLANLLLARGATRQREIAVRAALGARRSRLVRLLLCESAVVACAGGALGLGVAFWTKDLFLAWIARTNNWVTIEPKIDVRVLGFTLAVSLVAGLVVGIVPAVRATRVDLATSIKEGWLTSGSARSRLGRALMVAQVAISVVLLIGAGLMLRTVRNLRRADVGFDTRNVLLFSARQRPGTLPVKAQRARVLASYEALLEQIRRIPGVRQATYSHYPLLSGEFSMPFLYVPDRESAAREGRKLYFQQVHPTFFEAMGMRLVLGRGLSQLDAEHGTKVIVVNETLVRKYFGSGNPIGRRVGITKSPAAVAPDSELLEIVGVVRDAKFTTVRQQIPPTAFAPPATGILTYELRTAVEPMTLVPSVRILGQSGPWMFEDFRTQDEAAAQTFVEEQRLARLTAIFGALATLLAWLGLYGLVSYHVACRTHEIGVRMALGAQRGEVVTMVLGETLTIAAFGVAVGLLAALGLTQIIASMLFGLPRYDAFTLGGAAGFMLAVAAIAGAAPAWRAARVDPVVALRQE